MADPQLLLQTILYFAGSLTGFVAVIPLGVTTSNFGGGCIAYASADWLNSTYFKFTFGSKVNCDFNLYVCAFACIVYGIIMGAYFTLAMCRSRKDPSIGSQMWVMPFTLSNSLVAVTLFISSCMISVGFLQWCDSLVNGAKKQGNTAILNCADGQTHVNWKLHGNNYDGSTFYSFMTVSQTASWICFLIFFCQVVLCMFRLWRNRRGRSTGQIQDNPELPDDKRVIATIEPTA